MLSDLFHHPDDDHELGEDHSKDTNDPKIPYTSTRKPVGPRSDAGFVGLENQGATCYLNSLIQVMYMTPELRRAIFDLDPIELGINLVENDQKEEKEKSQKGVVEPDENMVEMLVAMGVDELKAKYCLIQTKNKGFDDALDFMDRLSEKIDIKSEMNKLTAASKKKKKPKYIPLELQRLFTELQLINRETVSTQDLTTKGFQWQSAEGHIQHDAHELNRLLIDALERSLKKTSNGERLCQNLYEGKVINQILCSGCLQISSREESFYDLNMQVTNCENLSTALHQYCEREILENDSAYQCDRCKGKKKAYRATKLHKLPNILTFSCNRFKIDRTTNWQRVKITSKSEYPILLNMNHFIYDYDLSLYYDVERESQNHHEKIDLHHQHLQFQAKESMLFLKDILKLAEQFIEEQFNLLFTPEQRHDIHFTIQNFQFNENLFQQFQQYLLNSSSSSSFVNSPDQNYLLHAIIIHRGSAYSGHYFAYIRDNLQEGNNIYNSKEFNLETILQTVLEEKNFVDDGNGGIGGSDGGSNGIEKKFILTNDYIFMKDENTFYISMNHLIGRVITIFRQEELQFKSKSKKKKFDKDKPFFLAVNTIVREISASLRQNNPSSIEKNQQLNYAKVYKPQYGDLEEFLSKFSLFFTELQPGQYSLNALNYYLLQENDYEMKLNKLRGEERAARLQQNQANHHDSTSVGNVWADSSKSFKEAVISEHNRSHDDSESVASVGEWQTANSKKHKSKKAAIKEEISSKINEANLNPPPSSPASNTSNHPSSKSIIINSEEAMSVVKKELVETLLHKTVGNFYEFNDSHVSLIPYEKLEKAFEGVNSSYLLVYRKLDHVSELFVPEKQQQQLIPSPPTEWKQRLTERNLALEQERKVYEDTMKHISIMAYLDEEMNYQAPFFTFQQQSSDKPSSDSSVKGQIITMDSTTSLKDLLSSLSLPEKYQQFRSNQTLALSKLERYPKSGYYASDPLDLSKTLQDHKIKTNDLLLIWSPQAASKDPATTFFYGVKSKPVELNVSLLQRSPSLSSPVKSSSGKESKSKISVNPNIHAVNKFDAVTYLPNHFTLLDVLLNLSEKWSIAPDELILSGVIPNFNSKTISTSTSNNAATNNAVENTRVVIVYKDLKYQLHQKQYYQLFINCPIEITEDTTLQDLWFLREFYVEHSATSNSASALMQENVKILSEEYHQQKSQIANVTIEITDSIRDLFVKDLPNGSSSSSSSLYSFDSTTIQLKVVKSSTLHHVKEELLHHFGLFDSLPFALLLELLNQTQFRLSNSGDEILLENEEVTLSSLAMKAKSKLILENKQITAGESAQSGKGEEQEEEEITLTVRLIHGNSTDVNYLLNDGGLVIRETTITVNREKSVRELRDMIGQQLLGFPNQWTVKEEECLVNVNFYNVSNPFAELQSFVRPVKEQTVQTEVIEEKTIVDQQAVVKIDDSVMDAKDFIEGYKGRRLRTTNWLKEFSDLLPERNKKNEIVLIKDTNLKTDDVVLFEEGTLPRKGVINMQIYLWKHSVTGYVPSLDTLKVEVSQKFSSDERKDSSDKEADKEKDEISKLEAKLVEVQTMKESQLLLIGEINFPYTIEVLQLYESVYNLLLFKNEKIMQSIASYQAPQDIQHLLLREFRFDFLPGKCFWLNTPTSTTTASAASIPINNIGVKASGPVSSSTNVNSNGANSTHPEKGANSILKKLGMKSDSKSLIIELLPVPQNQVKLTNYSYQIWIQRLLNPLSCSEGKAVMSPAWPPLSITISGGIKPSVGHLVRPINEKFPDISLENIVIYKYNANTNDWQLIKSPPASTGSAASAKAVTKANTTLMEGLKESDLLCVFSANDLLEGKTMTSLTPLQKSSLINEMLGSVVVSLPEDLFLQRLQQELKQNGVLKDKKKKGGKVVKSVQWLSSHLQNKLSLGRSGADGHPKMKRKEYALNIRTDFDSSDEEEEDN